MFTPKSIKHLILCHNICLICMENACDNINMDDSKFNDSPDKLNQYNRSSRQRLANEGNHNNSIDTERYVHDGTLVTVL